MRFKILNRQRSIYLSICAGLIAVLCLVGCKPMTNQKPVETPLPSMQPTSKPIPTPSPIPEPTPTPGPPYKISVNVDRQIAVVFAKDEDRTASFVFPCAL